MIITVKPSNKLNTKELTQELLQVQAGVQVFISEAINWASFPYNKQTCPDYVTPPADTTAPWTSPFVIEIQGGDEANRAAFEATVKAHNPAMSNREATQAAVNQKRAQELLEALMTLPDEYLSQIKARFDALP
jgi:hypothetical protein